MRGLAGLTGARFRLQRESSLRYVESIATTSTTTTVPTQASATFPANRLVTSTHTTLRAIRRRQFLPTLSLAASTTASTTMVHPPLRRPFTVMPATTAFEPSGPTHADQYYEPLTGAALDEAPAGVTMVTTRMSPHPTRAYL
jgi:hypothetical protein